jgi:hypothetical protein
MPSPQQFDTPSLRPLLPCPQCYKPMRIESIEVANGCESIKWVCDDCRAQETQHIEYK